MIVEDDYDLLNQFSIRKNSTGLLPYPYGLLLN